MNIDILKYILSDIGDVSWWGESNHDDESSLNMDTLDRYLTHIEDIREYLLGMLWEHKEYRKGNASAEHLHKKAGKIIQMHIIQDNDFNPLGENWSD